MEEYLSFAQELADGASEIALRYFGFEVESDWKQDDTPLTIADTEINDFVIRRINQAYPNHSILGEEKSSTKENSELIWVCDPIDGTIAFSSGMPIFVFSIALVDQSTGQPVLGLINDPVMKTTYWAYRGNGAYRNGKKIHVAQASSLERTYIAAGSTGKKLGFSPWPFMQSLRQKKCRQIKLPSFIYGGVQVAHGKFAAAVHYGKHAHDVASLKIIVEEAGGKVTDLNGEERRYDTDGLGCIISNGILHDEIVQGVQSGRV